MEYRYSSYILVLLFIATHIVQPAAGQISITSEDATSLIGESRSLTTFSSTDAQIQAIVDADGADQTWDFSQVSHTDTLHAVTTYHGSGDGLPGGDEFPETNYAIEVMMGLESPDVDSAAWVFNQIKGDSALTLGGSYITENPDTGEPDTLTLAFNPPSLNFLLPVTYGDSWTHTSTFILETTEEAEVDGWGTLVLPDGSSHDALRIRREETTSMGGFETMTTYIDILTNTQTVSAHLTLAEDNSTFHSAEITMEGEPTAAEHDELPQTVRLMQNHPNPFNPSTTLAFELANPERVTLTVHDVLGRAVAVLVDGVRPAGEHQIHFDAASLPSGTYVYQLRTSTGTQTRLMTLSK